MRKWDSSLKKLLRSILGLVRRQCQINSVACQQTCRFLFTRFYCLSAARCLYSAHDPSRPPSPPRHYNGRNAYPRGKGNRFFPLLRSVRRPLPRKHDNKTKQRILSKNPVMKTSRTPWSPKPSSFLGSRGAPCVCRQTRGSGINVQQEEKKMQVKRRPRKKEKGSNKRRKEARTRDKNDNPGPQTPKLPSDYQQTLHLLPTARTHAEPSPTDIRADLLFKTHRTSQSPPDASTGSLGSFSSSAGLCRSGSSSAAGSGRDSSLR